MRRIAFLLLLLASAPALAHEGERHAIGWTLDPIVTVPLGLAAALYAVGLVRLWRRSDRGRPALRRDSALFAAGWAVLAGALVSPLHEAGEASFTMHMIEHELIMLVAALLLVAARPGPAFLWAFPEAVRRPLGGAGRWGVWRLLADPFVATALQSAALVVWHVPALFDLALASEGWHIVQHLCFVVPALLFWRAMLHPRTPGLVAALCLFVTATVGGGLGALMALSASPWYQGYAALGMTPFGLTPQEDQQLAGLLMWIPGGMWHVAAAAWFLARSLARAGRQ